MTVITIFRSHFDRKHEKCKWLLHCKEHISVEVERKTYSLRINLAKQCLGKKKKKKKEFDQNGATSCVPCLPLVFYSGQ